MKIENLQIHTNLGCNSYTSTSNYLKQMKICFIIGCQRSGTTLTRLILESNPVVSAYDEKTSYDYWMKRNLLQNEISIKKSMGKSCFVFKIPMMTEQLNNFDSVLRFLKRDSFEFRYEDQSLLFLIRDPRDVCLSFKTREEKYGIKIEDRIVPEIKKIFPKIIPQFEKKYARELDIIANSKRYYNLANCALFWKIKTEAFFHYKKLNYSLLPIFYEELVTSTITSIKRICQFLKIPFNENMLRHHEMNHVETKKSGFTVGKTPINRSIDSLSIKGFKKYMNEDEQKLVLSIVEDTLEKILKVNDSP